jgi:hypothetical protein
MVVTALNEKDLQKMMREVEKFTRKWRLEVNAGKTEVVVFGKKNKRTTETKIQYGEITLKNVPGYTYLGIFQDRMPRARGKVRKESMLGKTKSKMGMAWGLGSRFGRVATSTGVAMWEGLIRPTLEYAAEVWHRGAWEEAEKVQRDMAKRILGCGQKTTNEAVLGELGWWRMQTRRDFLMVCYWAKICRMDDSRLIKRVYQERKKAVGKDRSSWCSKVHEILHRLDMGDKWLDEDVGSEQGWKDDMRKRIHADEEEQWRKNMENKPKLREYRKFKTSLVREQYLEDNTNWRGRQLMVGLRTGTNRLKIEQDRWQNIPVEWRLCPTCAVETESEVHFLTRCRYYQQEREEWAATLPQGDRLRWDQATEKERTTWLLNPPSQLVKAVKFLMVKCDIKRMEWVEAG